MRSQAAKGPRLPNTKQSKSVCCETSRACLKSEPEISSRANTGESSDVLSALGADKYVKHDREAAVKD